MEKIKDLRSILANAICECCKNADCETMENIFECADWTWFDHVTEERYHPTAREIRHTMYNIGKECMQSLLRDYETEEWGKETPKPYTCSTARLYFTIYWEQTDEDFDLLRDVTMSCGIQTECAISSIYDVSPTGYSVSTFVEDEECREPFDRYNE